MTDNKHSALDAMAGDGGYKECHLADVIRARMKRDGKRFWAGDNISDYLHETDREHLINEATEAFELVLDRLLIDRETDPNSQGTARRLAKMYYNEIMAGRYDPAPCATAFPNNSEERYEGMLVIRSELRSMCSHHHQPVNGVAYIGIIAAEKLIGLSKYTYCSMVQKKRNVTRRTLQRHSPRNYESHRFRKRRCICTGYAWLLRKSRYHGT